MKKYDPLRSSSGELFDNTMFVTVMRLGKKKEKTGEAEVGRAQTVDGVARLICSAKGSHNVPLKGNPYERCFKVQNKLPPLLLAYYDQEGWTLLTLSKL